jgi:thiamine biosynthesis lipoprotein
MQKRCSHLTSWAVQKEFFSLVIFFCCMLASSASHPVSQLYSFKSRHMGVDFRIDLFAADSKKAQFAANAAFARVAKIDSVMSDYKVESELSQLSRSSGSGNSVQVSQELWKVLNKAKKIHRLSIGAFDITSGPSVILWRRACFFKTLPPSRSLARAREKCGMNHLLFKPEMRSLTLKPKGMRLDLGGIAKGYAADEALKTLHSLGIKHALVDGSGDMAMTIHPRNQWKIFISDKEDQADQFIHMQNGAVATSGDSYQFIEIKNKRYSHIIDPRTGIGVTNRCRVTIIAPDAMTADSLASAVTVMGPKQGLKLIESLPDVEALIVTSGKTYQSTNFPSLIKKQNN